MSLKEIRREIRELDRVEGGLVPRGGCACCGKRTRRGATSGELSFLTLEG